MHTRDDVPKLFRCYVGQVENAEVRKPKYGNGSTETEIQKWEEKPPIGGLVNECAL